LAIIPSLSRAAPQPSTPAPAPAPAASARAAAQRAFFEAALAKTQAAPATAVSARAAPQPPLRTAAPIHADIPAEPPSRLARPGSIVDIKV